MIPSRPSNQRAVSHTARKRVAAGMRVALAMCGVFLFILTIVFIVFSVLPSDPARNALGMHASEDAVNALRHDLGYNRPIGERFARFILGAIQLDFGRSIHSRRPVGTMILEGLAITVRNGAVALLFSACASMLLASVGWFSRAAERGLLAACRFLTSIPSLILAITAGVFAYGVLGGLGDTGFREILGIAAALAVYPTCSLAEIAIGEARRVERCSFVTAVRSFGAKEPTVFARCVVPAILTSWAGHVSNVAASIFVSSAVFDAVFSLPGIGHLLVQSVVQNDLPVVQGLIIVIIVGFLSVDILFDRFLLPRLAAYGRSIAP